MDGMQPDECTPEVSWEVRWPSEYAADGMTVIYRRDQAKAIETAKGARSLGRKAKLYRVERTEVDF